MAKIGVGVIGCGDIARVRYFPSIEALPELELKAVHSRTSATCDRILGRYGGKFYGDLDSFLRDPAIEAVIVATPHPSHAGLSIRALEAGKHVLTEKPMATSLADAARVREATERSTRVFMALPFDHLPPMDEAKRLIQSGAIGRVSSADGVLAHQGPVHAPWFFDREKAGWGVLADLGIYLISQFTYLFGSAESVFGRVTTVFPERTSEDGETFKATVDDNIAAVIAWPDNILGSIRANWCSAADKRNFIWEVRIYGTAGIIFINMASPKNPLVVYAPGHGIEGAEKIVHNGMTDCYRPILPVWDPHKDIVRSFADAIAGGRPTADGRSSAARPHHVIEIIAKLYESSRTGRAMSLEIQC
jgi:UDP-N-acetylglucosamine 3-dehydrogenase